MPSLVWPGSIALCLHLPSCLICPPFSLLHCACSPLRRSYFFDTSNVKNGGNRWATVLMYLSDVEEGGETGAA